MSKRKKALVGAVGVFFVGLLVVYVVNVQETGRLWPAAAAPQIS